jgi:hypothetical protein
VIIENKIDQEDQTSQLSLYSQILHSEYGWAGKNVALVYLTPGGKRARDPRARSVSYSRMSYREHVSQWLNACVPRVGPPSVRACVSEYINVIENLTEDLTEELDEEG